MMHHLVRMLILIIEVKSHVIAGGTYYDPVTRIDLSQAIDLILLFLSNSLTDKDYRLMSMRRDHVPDPESSFGGSASTSAGMAASVANLFSSVSRADRSNAVS